MTPAFQSLVEDLATTIWLPSMHSLSNLAGGGEPPPLASMRSAAEEQIAKWFKNHGEEAAAIFMHPRFAQVNERDFYSALQESLLKASISQAVERYADAAGISKHLLQRQFDDALRGIESHSEQIATHACAALMERLRLPKSGTGLG